MIPESRPRCDGCGIEAVHTQTHVRAAYLVRLIYNSDVIRGVLQCSVVICKNMQHYLPQMPEE